MLSNAWLLGWCCLVEGFCISGRSERRVLSVWDGMCGEVL